MRGSTRGEWAAYLLSGLPGAMLAVAAAAGLVSERTALVLFAPSFVVLNLAHMGSAWGHAYLDAPGWRGAPVERLLLPTVLVTGAIGLEAAGWGALLLTAQYWISLYHASMQNYGLLRTTQRRSGRSIPPAALRVDQAACVLLILGALAYRARAVSTRYDGAVLLTPPPWLAPLCFAAGGAALAAFVIRECVAARRGEPVDALGVALVVGLNALWTGLLVGLEHPALPLYAIASGHYVQQLYFVWRFESTRDGFAALPSRLRRWIAPPARLGYVAGAVAAAGAVVTVLLVVTVAARRVAAAAGVSTDAAIPPWVAAMIGVNLWHYWLEHRIWRHAPALS